MEIFPTYRRIQGVAAAPSLARLEDPQLRARSRRVMYLLVLTLLLSIGDLIATLTCLKSVGMQELNPLAAHIIRGHGAIGLVIFKVLTLAASLSILIIVRRSRIGELAAWLAAMILITLTVRWSEYTDQMLHFSDTKAIEEAQSHRDWLILGASMPSKHSSWIRP